MRCSLFISPFFTCIWIPLHAYDIAGLWGGQDCEADRTLRRRLDCEVSEMGASNTSHTLRSQRNWPQASWTCDEHQALNQRLSGWEECLTWPRLAPGPNPPAGVRVHSASPWWHHVTSGRLSWHRTSNTTQWFWALFLQELYCNL